jgi:acyl-CoA thioesterase I
MEMKKLCLSIVVFVQLIALLITEVRAQSPQQDYLNEVKAELKKQWPANRTINLVFHGHSVPSGYFRTPDVRTLDAYPHQVLQQLKVIYPTAVINVITTSIGAENSVQGEKRLSKQVLVHRPDVLFIDYALNDRVLGLARAREATEKMIRTALKKKIKIILLTPSPDLSVKLTTPDNELEQFAKQIRAVAEQYHIGLADSYARFKELAEKGEDLGQYMSQSNHPDKEGHQIIAGEVMKYFN